MAYFINIDGIKTKGTKITKTKKVTPKHNPIIVFVEIN
jgi:hypothetical protein